MSFLQAIPESSQLFLIGAGLLFVGVLFRKLRKVLSVFRTPLPAAHQAEPKQS